MPEQALAALHAAMAQPVQARTLAGAASLVWQHGRLVDAHAVGHADIEAGVALRADHIHRIFSNTKLVTSVAALQLWEAGVLDLDEPVQRLLPALGQRQVLRPGATHIGDTEPARSPITLRQLLCHNAGLTYGIFDPASPLTAAYAQQRVLSAHTTLADMVDALAPLPLALQPGTGFEYSVATDVVARLLEVVQGQRFGQIIQQRVLQPLGMVDTGFMVPPAQQHRLATLYAGASVQDPHRPGLSPLPESAQRGSYRVPIARESGGGGLVSTLADMMALLRALLPGTDAGTTRLLKPETLQLLWANQLPAGQWQRFADLGTLVGRGHGLAGGLVLQAGPQDHPAAAGELYWGGVAGTHWLLHPGLGLAAALMVQRHMGFMHPAVAAWKRAVYGVAVA